MGLVSSGVRGIASGSGSGAGSFTDVWTRVR
jgi:hypothetical protein